MQCKECDRKAHARGLCGMHYKRFTSARPVRPTRDMSTEERFFHYVDKRPDGCWLWAGATFGEGGYGAFGVGGKTIAAHVYSYIIRNGAVPSGMCVCHTCDVRNCVNPDHLFLGTTQDNTQDMINKGRFRIASGDAHYKTKIKEADLPKIFEMAKSMSQKAIAQHFGVYPSHICRILSGHKRGRASVSGSGRNRDDCETPAGTGTSRSEDRRPTPG